jgi:2-iminobutanoate/2-iminopropanoate deaminase
VAKSAVTTQDAPGPVAGAPYSQAVVSNGFVFVAGQVGLQPGSAALVGGGVEAQAEQVFDNLEAILRAAGSTLAQVVKATVFLSDMSHFATVNEVYARRMPAPFPARSAFAVRELPMGAEVEIEVIAEL